MALETIPFFDRVPFRRRIDVSLPMCLWLGTCLLILFVTLAVADSASDYYVHSLPGQPDGPLLNMHAG